MDELQEAARKAVEDMLEPLGIKTLKVHVTPGPMATPENIAREVQSAIRQMLDGTATISDSFDDDAETVDVRELFKRES